MAAEQMELLIWLVPLLAAAGALAGVLAGLLGVGGGIVIVPALYHIFSALGIDPDVRMHVAVGTSLATIIPTSIRSMRAHQAKGSFDPEMFRLWIPGIVIGVILGTILAGFANGVQLTSVFGVVGLIVAIHMAFARDSWRLGDSIPTGVPAQGFPVGIGAISAMMGIGGGTLSVPTMSLFGFPIHRAVGTAAAFGLVIAIPGCLGFVIAGLGSENLPPFSTGYVNWIGFALIVPMTVLTAPMGASLAHKLSQRGLKNAFAVFLAITALRMLYDVFSGAI